MGGRDEVAPEHQRALGRVGEGVVELQGGHDVLRRGTRFRGTGPGAEYSDGGGASARRAPTAAVQHAPAARLYRVTTRRRAGALYTSTEVRHAGDPRERYRRGGGRPRE